MAKKLIGSVDAKRISEFLKKLLTANNLKQYNVLIDNPNDDTSFKVLLSDLQDAFSSSIGDQVTYNTMYRPDDQPVVDTGVVTLDCDDRSGAMFEPRLSIGTRIINTDFTQAFTNTTFTNLVSAVYSFTGTIVVTMPSSVEVSNPSSIGAWNDGTKVLTISAGTSDKIEFQYLWNITEAIWMLKVSEVSL